MTLLALDVARWRATDKPADRQRRTTRSERAVLGLARSVAAELGVRLG